ncbi:SNARE domain-containing protein [Cryptosporidium canis]|uniref:SNARE domain-containing protein n=1 Tax=Cryptosporidium canis TaxID=195482 RepID=A0A9D5DIQ6_9CRYT|nr:SNARE domain-containing protein [Cryptosporidium canis]
MESIYTGSQDYRGQDVTELQDECKKAIRNALRIAADANEISMISATKLNEQTEQLNKIDNETEKIKDNLDKTDYAIRSLKNPILFWFKDLFGQNKSNKKKPKTDLNQEKAQHEKMDQDNSYSPKSKKQNFVHDRGCQFDDEIDEGLDQIGNMLKEMHSRALNMNSALKNQGEILNKIDANIDNNNSRMKDQRTELGRFIGK